MLEALFTALLLNLGTMDVNTPKVVNPPAATRQSQCEFPGRIWNQAARKHGVDPLLLYSVALFESNRNYGNQVRPHPFALHFNRAGISIYAESKKQAKFVLDHVTTDNVDIGLGQVNYHHHKDKVQSPEELLDPETNLKVASKILAHALSSTSDLELGVGRYHSWTEWRARAYGRQVLAIYQALKKLVRKEDDSADFKERG